MSRALSTFVLLRRTMADGRAAPAFASLRRGKSQLAANILHSYPGWLPPSLYYDATYPGLFSVTPFGGFDSVAAR